MRNLRGVVLLFVSHIVSVSVQGVTLMAVPWYCTRVWDVGDLLGMVYSIATGMTLVWTVYGGVLADRLRRHTLLAMGTAVNSLLVGAGGALAFMYEGSERWVGLLVFGLQILYLAFYYPTFVALLHEVVEARFYGRVASGMELLGQLAAVVGGGLGMLLLGAEPPLLLGWFLVLQALAGFFQWFLLVFVVRFVPVSDERKGDTRVSGWQMLVDGWKYLRRDRQLAVFGTGSLMMFVSVMTMVYYILPVYIDRVVGATGRLYAQGEMLFAAGAMGAALYWLVVRGVPVRPFLATFFQMVLGAVAYLVIVVIATWWALLVGWTLAGIANAGTRICRVTYVLGRVSIEFSGRVNGFFNAFQVLARAVLIGCVSVLPVESVAVLRMVVVGMVLVVFGGALLVLWSAKLGR